MEGQAEGILKDLADTCSGGAFLFRDADAENAYCSLLLTDTGVHSICRFADEETTMVSVNGQHVSRHRCLAKVTEALEISPAESQ